MYGTLRPMVSRSRFVRFRNERWERIEPRTPPNKRCFGHPTGDIPGIIDLFEGYESGRHDG